MTCKILCLGNEFIREDSLAKEISHILKKELKDFEVIQVKDSFQLMTYLNENKSRDIIILDVVKGLKEAGNKVITINSLNIII